MTVLLFTKLYMYLKCTFELLYFIMISALKKTVLQFIKQVTQNVHWVMLQV